MLQQKKFHFPRLKLDEKKLNEYAGTYVQNVKDSIHLIIQDGKLMVKEHPLELVPTTANSFFIVLNDVEMEIKFKRDIRRKIDKLLIMGDEVTEFRKVK